MKQTRHGLTFNDKGKERLVRLCPTIDGEVAVVCADLPTGRTPTFTLQLLKSDPEFEPLLRTEIVNGPKRGGRQAQVLTTSGVRKLVQLLEESKPQPRHSESNKEAIQWIREELIPEMEAMETTVGRPKGILVGKPQVETVGRPSNKLKGSIVIQIGATSFSADSLDPDVDTVSYSSGMLSRTWTARQLIEVMEHHRF